MEPTSPTNTTAAAPGIELETAAAEERFQAFMRIPDQAAMLSFAVEQEDAALDDLERTVAARLAAAQGDEATAIRQRLEGLRRLRSEDLATARAVTAAVAQMSHAERLQLMFETVTDAAGMMGLVAATADDDLDRLEAAAEARIAAAGGEEGLQQRLDDLRRWRTTEQAARATLAPLGEAGGQALADQLVTWIQTPDWDASETFLAAHAAELLTDAGAAALTLLRMNNPGHEAIEQHGPLLAACRQIGVEAAYAQLRRGLAQQAQLERLQQSRLGQAVIAFVQAEDADAAAQLQSQNLLTTTDARDALQMLLDRAIQAGDTPAAARIADRLALVQTARLCLLYTSPSPRDRTRSRMPSSA